MVVCQETTKNGCQRKMPATFVAILTAHLLGDFIFHPDWMLQRKRDLPVLLLHVATVTAASFLLLGTLHWQLLIAIFVARLVMDAIKVCWLSDSLRPFLIDQTVRLAVLLALAYVFPDAAKNGWWMRHLGDGLPNWYFASLSLISGLILCVPAGGILIAKCTKHFTEEIGEADIGGLKKGGQYIGWLERSLVMLLLLINQPSGIGFLIAAKSILRFGEIKEPAQRKVAEYIIIGTFLSFGWAILISVLTQQSIQYWLPP
jgi:hypothetical protein